MLKSLRCIPRLKAISELMVEFTFCHHSLDYWEATSLQGPCGRNLRLWLVIYGRESQKIFCFTFGSHETRLVSRETCTITPFTSHDTIVRVRYHKLMRHDRVSPLSQTVFIGIWQWLWAWNISADEQLGLSSPSEQQSTWSSIAALVTMNMMRASGFNRMLKERKNGVELLRIQR